MNYKEEGFFVIINADFHIHSCFSMATSKSMRPEIIAPQAKLKGLDLVGSGDALHEGWLKQIERNTEEINEGIYALKPEKYSTGNTENQGCNFVLTTEVEDIKRVHHLLILPSLEAAYNLRKKLVGNLDADGRPKIRMEGKTIMELAYEEDCLIGPSHAFTPWTSLYKEYDSIYHCYGNKPDFLELGLSADTDMADRIEELQDIPFLTNSDAHSPWPHRLGREFNEIELKKLNFKGLKEAINGNNIKANYGFDPRLGKYHRTACTKCYKQYPPKKALEMNMKCPCGGRIKKGVDYRVDELSTWQEPHHPSHRPDYIHILPLAEIISLTYNKGVTTKFVQSIWRELVEKFDNEISVLIDSPMQDLYENDPRIARRIRAFRDRTLKIEIGGGGKYGKIIFQEDSTLDSYFDF